MKKIVLFLFSIFFMLTGCNLEVSEKTVQDISGIENINAMQLPRAIYFNHFNYYDKTGMTNKLNQMFYKYFYSDKKIYHTVGKDKAYILDNGNNDVRSEGMSYGMMICVQLGKRAEFDKLWKYAYTYMRNTGTPGLFYWCVNPNGTYISKESAPDGEEWFAMALTLAHNTWGSASGTGYKNYSHHAYQTVNAIKTKLLKNNLITFQSHGGGYDNYTDPSYMTPFFYTTFRWVGTSSTRWSGWNTVASNSRYYLKKAMSLGSTNCLIPDYTSIKSNNYGAGIKGYSSNTRENHHDEFRHDAWRVAMNIALDAEYNSPGSYGNEGSKYWVTQYATRLCNFFEKKSSASWPISKRNYKNTWKMNGTKGYESNSHSAGLVAMNAMISVWCGSRAMAQRYIAEMWHLPMPNGYYDACLYMLSMCYLTGNFSPNPSYNWYAKL